MGAKFDQFSADTNSRGAHGKEENLTKNENEFNYSRWTHMDACSAEGRVEAVLLFASVFVSPRPQ